MSKNTIFYLLLGVGAYYLYTSKSASAASGYQYCKFPDGTVLTLPAGSACPYDSTHGGQSALCMGANFIGPLGPGQTYC